MLESGALFLTVGVLCISYAGESVFMHEWGALSFEVEGCTFICTGSFQLAPEVTHTDCWKERAHA